MRRSILLLAILASLLVSGCKSGAQKKAESAKAEYEQTVRDGGKQRVRIVNERLKASGLMPIDTTIVFSMFDMKSGAELEQLIEETLKPYER